MFGALLVCRGGSVAHYFRALPASAPPPPPPAKLGKHHVHARGIGRLARATYLGAGVTAPAPPPPLPGADGSSKRRRRIQYGVDHPKRDEQQPVDLEQAVQALAEDLAQDAPPMPTPAPAPTGAAVAEALAQLEPQIAEGERLAAAQAAAEQAQALAAAERERVQREIAEFNEAAMRAAEQLLRDLL